MTIRLALRSIAVLALLAAALASPSLALRPPQPGEIHTERLCGYTPWVVAYSNDSSVTIPPGSQPLTLAECQAELDNILRELSDEGYFIFPQASCSPVYCRK